MHAKLVYVRNLKRSVKGMAPQGQGQGQEQWKRTGKRRESTKNRRKFHTKRCHYATLLRVWPTHRSMVMVMDMAMGTDTKTVTGRRLRIR